MASLLARQTIVTNDQGQEFIVYGCGFWCTRAGQIVRWSLFLGILFLFAAYMGIGYWHAKRRISKGLPPLRYHRWLLNRDTRARYDPSFRQNPRVFYNNYPQGGQYNMENMAPPPLYNPNGSPPVYQGPEGASKVDPSQWRSEPTRRPAESGEQAPGYDAPAGPPPAMHPNHTGATAVGNNSYRL